MKPGRFVSSTGEELGAHDGHQHFTVGQRKGIGLASSIPLFVLEKRASCNEVVVGPRDQLESDGLVAGEVNWLEAMPSDWFQCHVRIRYNSEAVPGCVRLVDDGKTLEVKFDSPQTAVAPGQAVVCYDGDLVLGGAWIQAGNHVGTSMTNSTM